MTVEKLTGCMSEDEVIEGVRKSEFDAGVR
jgi:hypothetical protein